MNLAQILQPGAQAHPHALAVAQGPVRLTYEQFTRDARAVALHLRALGIAPGQMVAVDLARPISHWLVLLALMRLGAVTVSLTGQRDAELAALTNLATVIVAEGDTHPYPPGLRTIALGKEWLRVPPEGDTVLPDPEVAALATGRIVFTSGTAGRAKAFLLPAAALHARLSGTARRTLITARTVLWCGLGPDTAYGFTATLAGWASGAMVVLARGGPGDFQTLTDRHANLLLASPAALAGLMRDAATTDLPRLAATAIVAGGRLPAGQRDALLARLCSEVYVAFGASESGGVALGDAAGLDRDPGHVGRVFDDIDCRIVGEAGQDLPANSAGRLLIRSPAMTTAYLNAPEATARHFAHGWFAPGDTARLSDDRVLTMLGRPVDTLNLGGVKLQADDIDAAARTLPGVLDACAVVLNPDGAGQLALVIVGQFVAPVALAAALRVAIPTLPRLTLVTVPALPRGTMGKVNRAALAASIIARETDLQILGEF